LLKLKTKMNKLHITVVLATAREGRESAKVAQFIQNELTSRDNIEVEFVDVKDHLHGVTVPAWIEDERTDKWKNTVKNSDAIIFVETEYNHSYPGELKILFDSAFKEYNKKPIAIVAVSSGGFGGARAIEAFWTIVVAVSAVAVPASLNISNVADSFSKEGEVKDKKTKERAGKMIDEVLLYANKFKKEV